MRKLTLLALLGALLSFGAIAALASPEDDHDQPWQEHPHMLVIGVEFNEDGLPISVKKCVDLAANQALPLNAHHVHVHFGTAGAQLAEKAGNFVVPAAPFGEPIFPAVPWTDCDSLLAFFGL